jgi:hypothetical protein
MNAQSYDLATDRQRTRSKSHRMKPKLAGRNQTDDGFLCKHCNVYVSGASFLSGVENRNHCPYCLWSRHLDLYAAGDRLSACKSPMKPIGVSVKATGKKYGSARGELMLIHLCTDCERLSINRIAADDIPQTVFSVFEASFRLDSRMRSRLETDGIAVLTSRDSDTVHAQLFGHGPDLAEMLFSAGVVTPFIVLDE